jgi:hypothetical protein
MGNTFESYFDNHATILIKKNWGHKINFTANYTFFANGLVLNAFHDEYAHH